MARQDHHASALFCDTRATVKGRQEIRVLHRKTKPGRPRLTEGAYEAGKIVPVIDRRYRLSETAQAIRYLEDGQTRGKVIITVDNNDHNPAPSGSYISSRSELR